MTIKKLRQIQASGTSHDTIDAIICFLEEVEPMVIDYYGAIPVKQVNVKELKKVIKKPITLKVSPKKKK